MTSPGPRITIGLPVFNGENFLEDAVDSILRQSYRDFRLLIADNASTDRTEEICRRYAAADPRVEYCRHPRNIGAARNFNFVFLHSDTEYFKWAAHDDIVGPDYLKMCIERLDQDRSLAMCHTLTATIDAQRRVTGTYDTGLPLNGKRASERFYRILWADYFNEVWAVMRTSVLRKTRLYGSFVGSDRSLIAEIVLQGDVAYLPRYEFYRRDHDGCYCKAMRTTADRAKWFDPEQGGRVLPPGLVKFVYSLSYLWEVDLKAFERAVCIGSLMNWALRRFVDALRRKPGQYRPRFDDVGMPGAGAVPQPPARMGLASLAGMSGGGA